MFKYSYNFKYPNVKEYKVLLLFFNVLNGSKDQHTNVWTHNCFIKIRVQIWWDSLYVIGICTYKFFRLEEENKPCEDNKCHTLIDEYKEKIINVQEVRFI